MDGGCLRESKKIIRYRPRGKPILPVDPLSIGGKARKEIFGSYGSKLGDWFSLQFDDLQVPRINPDYSFQVLMVLLDLFGMHRERIGCPPFEYDRPQILHLVFL